MSKKLKNQESKYVRVHVLIEEEQKEYADRNGNRSECVRQLIEKDMKLSTGKN